LTLSVGDRAPDFQTRNQHGEQVARAQLTGAPAVLVFYPWAFSGICTGELSAFREHQSDFDAAGARVLAVSCDAMFSLRVFAEQERLEFDLLTDHWPHGGIARAYGVFDEKAGCALRGTFVIDADGIIRWHVVNGIGEARDITELLAALTS
jgi:peroxiredoxin